ncbi:MAG TPA: hypothetical protein VH988_23885 [Thermoanaerobaculia bacterium]|nr:hypothetical protein [Thermoanaerobaculia bacterium]
MIATDRKIAGERLKAVSASAQPNLLPTRHSHLETILAARIRDLLNPWPWQGHSNSRDRCEGLIIENLSTQKLRGVLLLLASRRSRT